MGEFDDGFEDEAKRGYQIMTVYCAHGDGGDEYRRGPVIGVFTDENRADRHADGKGWYGGNGGVSERKAIHLSDGTVYLIEGSPIDLNLTARQHDAEVRLKALNKLTAEEKRILGIKEE